nr:DUF4272 domain-containing protein [Rikenella sp.]
MATKQPTKESAAEERHITLYTAIGNIERIGQTIHTCFEKTTKQIEQRGNALILTLPDDTQVTFVIHHRQFNAEFLDKHIAGMMNFFSRVETDRTELQQNVLLQISLFNCVIGTAFTLDDNEDRTSYIVGTIQETAEQLNAFLLYEDMTLYTPKHRLLFSIGGDSEFTEYLPIANSDLRRVGRAEESDADRNRKERSTKQLRQEGVPVNE